MFPQPPVLPLQQICSSLYSAAAFAADFAVTVAAGEPAITPHKFRIRFGKKKWLGKKWFGVLTV